MARRSAAVGGRQLAEAGGGQFGAQGVGRLEVFDLLRRPALLGERHDILGNYSIGPQCDPQVETKYFENLFKGREIRVSGF